MKKPIAIRMEDDAKWSFKIAAAMAGVSEGELATRLLGGWAEDYRAGKAEVPEPVTITRPNGRAPVNGK